MLAASQAYIEYQEMGNEESRHILQAIGVAATRLLQFPEYLMASRSLAKECFRRGLPDTMPLEAFAVGLKGEIERDIYDVIPCHNPENEALLQEFDESINRGDFARARTVYTKLEGTKELSAAYAYAIKRILYDQGDTRGILD